MAVVELKTRFHDHVRSLQDEIVAALAQVDPELKVREDRWTRTAHDGGDGGGGITRALTGGVFENAGVNTSLVYGAIDPRFAMQLGGSDNTLWAAGISLILHPRNPHVPTVHANFRMIELGERRWFGGGADLTPYYPHEDDFRHFHGVWRDACAPWGCYPSMKARCDAYFTNHHRDGEMRGIGGIFFDHLTTDPLSAAFEQTVALSRSLLPSYLPIVARRRDEAYGEADEDFMLHRRGRYVEFNLVHDRGTLFGLRTGGRSDSILISLPARCRFTYAWAPEPGTPYATMTSYYRPRDWSPAS